MVNGVGSTIRASGMRAEITPPKQRELKRTSSYKKQHKYFASRSTYYDATDLDAGAECDLFRPRNDDRIPEMDGSTFLKVDLLDERPLR